MAVSISTMLDQVMVTRTWPQAPRSKVDPATVLILKPPALVNPGVNPKPCVSPNGAVCWVAVTEEPASATAAVDLLADRADLIEAVTDLRWLEWGHAPEPIDRDWWHAATVREAGSSGLPMTWVASDQSGVLGAVGLGRFDIEERRDRSPWLLGMIVRPDRRRSGVASTGDAGGGSMRRLTATLSRRPSSPKSHEPSRCSASPCRFRVPCKCSTGAAPRVPSVSGVPFSVRNWVFWR
jgi:hypothetical protein